jgi:hypothetical protein
VSPLSSKIFSLLVLSTPPPSLSPLAKRKIGCKEKKRGTETNDLRRMFFFFYFLLKKTELVILTSVASSEVSLQVVG